MNCWEILGLQPGAEERDIKRRYAQLVKIDRPEDFSEAWQQLHDAYEQAYVMTTKISGKKRKKSNRSIYPGVLFILVL